MQIPTFWARASGEATSPLSKRLVLMAWGWSATDQSEAAASAKARLARMIDRVASGESLPARYTYGDRPIREERLEDFSASDGTLRFVVTRNRYGSLVLNAARAMFIDIDLPAARPRSSFGALFRKAAPDPAEPVLARVRDALAALAPRAFRIYSTAAGFRVLAMDREHEADTAETMEIMTAVGADPAYMQLCRAQQSFRARLTPKPWRCKLSTPPGVFPREEPAVQEQFARWVTDYDSACRGHATCRFIEQVGAAASATSVAPVLALHDRLTLAASDLPLA